MNCYKCNKQLGADAEEFGRTLCHECRVCDTCHLMLSPAETRYISENLLSYVRCAQCILLVNPLDQIATVHPSPELIPRESITLSKAEYDLLNLCRNLCTPLTGLSNETNEQDAAIQTERLIFDKSAEFQLLMMRKMQAAAGAIKVALLRSKAKIEDVERDISRRRGTELDRTLAEEKRKANKKIEETAEKNLSPLERKKRRVREQGILLFMRYGMDRTEATKQYDRAKAIEKVQELQKVTRKEAEAIVDSPDYGKLPPEPNQQTIQ